MASITLIFDAGSTKTEVGVIDRVPGGSPIISTLLIPGINPAVSSEEYIMESLNQVKVKFPDYILDIHFYGAGCATERTCGKIRDILLSLWPSVTKVEVASDMLGAARALLKKNPGVACILGTGSNTTLYDGCNLIDNVPPLGFILGDEGSGTALGKRLIGDVFKRIAPEEIRNKFFEETELTKEIVIEKVYRGETPNKFLASVVPFIKQNLDNRYIKEMTKEVFDDFFERNLMQYEGIKELPVNFAGSIAYHFQDMIREVATSKGLHIGDIEAKPMNKLIEYHI